ncbi:hypothetical protein M407DRAFT_223207 [Tulasnella calospora MUT 4182]|uniref:T6SS Phospholipase effector Tle1-like catalytic domain-containing protein n=1 Tax=Tulasnella calospora MUT 4182 TaxID=1051891 RepID=A0A0C3KCW8_9AGAM|nr:hypothetical protein M407DRAFT_223207 [Tulasnella calospora MUT 4182]
MSPQNTPLSRLPKTIVLAFDGTANKFGARNTNVIRLFSMLEKEKPDEQVVYYQPGLGTYLASEAAWSPTEKAISELMDKALALYLDVHIMDGYRFLMANYKQNDRVCMFGFSRGAYTARCLAGMLKKALVQVGLLLPGNDQMVASAYEHYLDLSPRGTDLASDFKEAFSIECPIEFLGLWDTVSSVGIRNSKHLPLTASNSQVKTVRHALALDERRAKFRPNRWHLSSRNCDEEARWRRQEKTPTAESVCPENSSAIDRASLRRRHRVAESSGAAGYNRATDVIEVWFAGDHSDVGGGRKAEENRPSNPSLAWMISEIIRSKVPILFKQGEHLKPPTGFEFSSTRKRLTVPGDTRSNLGETTMPTHEEMKHLQQRDKSLDAKSQIHDALTKTWLWWTLECLPFRHSTSDEDFKGWRRSV